MRDENVNFFSPIHPEDFYLWLYNIPILLMIYLNIPKNSSFFGLAD